MRILVVSALALSLGLAHVPMAVASGGYAPAPMKRTPERQKYHLGKDVVMGYAKLPEQPISEELEASQKERLGELAEKLATKGAPKRVSEKLADGSLAGRLDDRHMAALEHYLQERYLSVPTATKASKSATEE